METHFHQRYSNNISEIFKDLATILKSASPKAHFISDTNSRKIIKQMSKKLSFEERTMLFMNFLHSPGTILYDAAGLFEAKIRIDDKDSDASENRPLAYIEFSDGYRSRVEVIDILESVRCDATLIGHPVILYAIHHWQKILVWEKYNQDDNVDSEEWINYLVSGRYVESARKNLEAIGKAMFEAVRRQAIPKEYALVLKIRDLKLENRDTYLFVAWDRLASRNINQTHEPTKRVNEIETYLRQLPTKGTYKQLADCPVEMQKYGYIDDAMEVSIVIDFLKADGSKFVYCEDNPNSLRPRWKVFKNAFIKWYYQKKGTTIEKYIKIAKKQEIDESPFHTSLLGSASRPTNLYTWFYHVLTKPLVHICEPIECSTAVANSSKFGDLITQTKTE